MQRFVNRRVNVRYRNFFDAIGQPVEIVLISAKGAGTLLAGWRILENPYGPDGQTLLIRQRPAKQVFYNNRWLGDRSLTW